MPDKKQFSDEIRRLFRAAELRGTPSIEVNSGKVHRRLGDYPGMNHQMPSCCQAMYDELNPAKDQIVSRPRKGYGASLTIRYSLPRER